MIDDREDDFDLRAEMAQEYREPEWVGLTDEEIGVPSEPIQPHEAALFARVIEALLKAKNGGAACD